MNLWLGRENVWFSLSVWVYHCPPEICVNINCRIGVHTQAPVGHVPQCPVAGDANEYKRRYSRRSVVTNMFTAPNIGWLCDCGLRHSSDGCRLYNSSSNVRLTDRCRHSCCPQSFDRRRPLAYVNLRCWVRMQATTTTTTTNPPSCEQWHGLGITTVPLSDTMWLQTVALIGSTASWIQLT